MIIRVHRNSRVQCFEVFVSLSIDGRRHLHLKCGIGAGVHNYNHIMTGYLPEQMTCINPTINKALVVQSSPSSGGQAHPFVLDR